MKVRFLKFVSGSVLALAVPATAIAQTRCDSSVAIGHIKRVEGPVGGVTIVRVGGAMQANPSPLTLVCPMDQIRTNGVGVAHVDVYNSPPVVVRSFSPWKPVRARTNNNMRQNVLAMVMDKFLPDLGRTETSQRLRGGPLDPTIARVPGMRTGTDMLPIEELGGVIRVPVYGELWLSQAQLRGPDGALRPTRATEGQDLVFDAAGLPLGRYEIIASKAPSNRLPPPTRSVGTFTLVAGRGPSPDITGRHPYAPDMVIGLRALWLADNHGSRHGLLAYQLATRSKMETIPPEKVAELVLTTLSPPVATPSVVTPNPVPAKQ